MAPSCAFDDSELVWGRAIWEEPGLLLVLVLDCGRAVWPVDV